MVGAFSGCCKILLSYLGFGNRERLATGAGEKKTNQAVVESNIQLPKNSNKEILTDLKMQELFGANYEGLMYYNFDAGKWNCDRFMGFCVPYQDKTEQAAIELKKILDAELERKNWEVVALVTTMIRDKYFQGIANKVNRPVFNKRGKSVVGTIVRRDKNTGKILGVPVDWTGVYCDDTVCGAIWFAAKNFLNYALQLPEFRSALVRVHSR